MTEFAPWWTASAIDAEQAVLAAEELAAAERDMEQLMAGGLAHEQAGAIAFQRAVVRDLRRCAFVGLRTADAIECGDVIATRGAGGQAVYEAVRLVGAEP